MENHNFFQRMENLKMILMNGRSKDVPDGWKIKSSIRMEKLKMHMKDGETKKSSRRMEIGKTFQMDGKLEKDLEGWKNRKCS